MTKSRNLIAKRKIWTPDELLMLKHLYPNTFTATLAKLFGCNIDVVYHQAHRIDLKKSAWYAASPMAQRLRADDSPGKAHRFQKGHVPANKGIKGVTGNHPNSRATQFKKGQKPHQTMPIGSYRLDKDETLQRKISEQSGNNSKRWRSVHELVWIEHNGPVPPGHICVFKPGMRTNKLEEITIDRVDCISLADHLRRNSVHRYGKKIAQLSQLRAQITRQINKRNSP